jgi:hypothetical protein
MTTMRLALLTVVALSTLALARAPSRIGSSREEECPAPPPAQERTADLVLLRALGWAFEPAPVEVRAQAIEDLGLLGDPRALNALAELCFDPNPVLSKAAVRAIASIRAPRAEEILANVVRHPGVTEATRVRALELLPYQNTWSALRFIHFTASQPNPSAAVGNTAARLSRDLPRPPPFVTPAGGG